jgi:hypothetical protein
MHLGTCQPRSRSIVYVPVCYITSATCKCLNALLINFGFLTCRLGFHPWLVLVYLQVLTSTGHGYIQKYEDLQRKIHNCNANIYFNKNCLWKNLIPNCARVKIPHTSPISNFTQQKIAGWVLYHLHILSCTGGT